MTNTQKWIAGALLLAALLVPKQEVQPPVPAASSSPSPAASPEPRKTPRTKKPTLEDSGETKKIQKVEWAPTKAPSGTDIKVEKDEVERILEKAGIRKADFKVAGEHLLVGGRLRYGIITVPFRLEGELSSKDQRLTLKLNKFSLRGDPANPEQFTRAQQKVDSLLGSTWVPPGTTLTITSHKRTIYHKKF